MLFAELKEGKKFNDPGLLSSPPEYRLHRVIEVGAEEFTAEHLASGNVRRFSLDRDVLAKLETVGTVPVATASLDPLVGEKVRMLLVNGTTVSGVITAVRYHRVKIGPTPNRSPKEIELDRSGITSYPWHEIASVTTIGS